jgi:cytochrome c oxidase subunit IV
MAGAEITHSGAERGSHAGHAGHGDHQEHASHPKASFYIVIFFILLVVTILEVFVAQEPLSTIFTGVGIPIAVPLIALAIAKFLMIAAFYMHLKGDSRVFTAFLAVGLILAIGMWLTFQGLFTAHYREPFDETAWRREMANQSGAGGATTGTSASTGGH